MFTFTGKVTQNIWNSEVVQLTDFPGGSSQGNPYQFNINYTKNITWNNPASVPAQFLGQNINQIIQKSPVESAIITVTPSVVISNGIQQYIGSLNPSAGYPFIFYFLYSTDGTVSSQSPWISAPGSQANENSFATWAPPNIPYNFEALNIGFFATNSPSPMYLTINIWNNCNSGPGACGGGPASNMTLDFILNISISIDCLGSELETEFCKTTCTSSPSNVETCYTEYVSYCFPTNQNTIIGTSVGCQDFFKTYMSGENGPGSNGFLDSAFSEYCTKYSGFMTLESASQSEQDICACHLKDEIYLELQQALEKQFPGYGTIPGEDVKCFFPQCASSDYPTNKIGKKCLIPQCVNIANISNDGGTIGGVTIKQTDGACANITGNGAAGGGGGGGTNPNEKSWIEKNWIWVILGLGLLISLIIVLIIFLSGEDGKKKKPKTGTETETETGTGIETGTGTETGTETNPKTSTEEIPSDNY